MNFDFQEFWSIARNRYIVIGIIVVIIGMVAFVLTRPQPQAIIVQQPVTLTWWTAFEGRDTYDTIINDFKRIPGNDKITINVVKKDYGDGSQYYRQLLEDIAKNAGPDMFSIRNDDLPAYQQFMAPIQIFQGAELTQYKNDFVDLAVSDTIYRDEVYAITTYVENLQLYYNKNILAQAGISTPPKTWTELDRQLPLLNKRNPRNLNFSQSAISLGTGGLIGGNININRMEDILPMLIFQNGGQIYDPQTDSVQLGGSRNASDVNLGQSTNNNFDVGIDRDAPALKALTFFNSFADPNELNNRYSWNSESSNNIDAFVEGRLAYMIHYSYMKDIIDSRSQRLDYDVTELPQVDPNIKRTYGFFFMDGINRDLQTSTDPVKQNKYAAAQRFLYYLSQPAAQRAYAAKTRQPSAHRTVIAEQGQGDNFIRTFSRGSLYSRNYYKPKVDETEKIWRDMMFRIQFEAQPPDRSLAQAIREYNRLVAGGAKTRG